MNEILSMNVDELTGYKFNCSCGRVHTVDINKIMVSEGAIVQISDIASSFKSGMIFLMADNNTYRICGETVKALMVKECFNVREFIFNNALPLVPDEEAIGRLLVEIEKNTSLLIAVGSGSLNDLAKIISSKINIPYIIVATAPSMDGYASTVSPLIIEGYKKTFEAVCPYAIIADIDILKEAPVEMRQAGFGDIIGKFTALADWELSRKLNGEYYCETSVNLVKNALKKCLDNYKGIITCDSKAIKYLTEVLILSGIAMGLVGNSRPASGAEHHLAHYWEMDALSKRQKHPLHGNMVGVGTVIISSIYELIGFRDQFHIEIPKPEEIKLMLRKVGACDNPSSLGISRELFHRSIIHALEVRPRYTVLQYASQMGYLEKFADELTKRFYE
jgi:glycerol-1-phosphate dehydrogenase [NAD(P)+]